MIRSSVVQKSKQKTQLILLLRLISCYRVSFTHAITFGFTCQPSRRRNTGMWSQPEQTTKIRDILALEGERRRRMAREKSYFRITQHDLMQKQPKAATQTHKAKTQNKSPNLGRCCFQQNTQGQNLKESSTQHQSQQCWITTSFQSPSLTSSKA